MIGREKIEAIARRRYKAPWRYFGLVISLSPTICVPTTTLVSRCFGSTSCCWNVYLPCQRHPPPPPQQKMAFRESDCL